MTSANYKVLEKVSAKAVGVDVARYGVETGFTKFLEMPIGQATRKARFVPFSCSTWLLRSVLPQQYCAKGIANTDLPTRSWPALSRGERTGFRRGSVGPDMRGLLGTENRHDSGPPALAHDVPLAVMPFASLLYCRPLRRVLPAHRHGGGRIGDQEVTVIVVQDTGRSRLNLNEGEQVHYAE